jgi:hypothetical protein
MREWREDILEQHFSIICEHHVVFYHWCSCLDVSFLLQGKGRGELSGRWSRGDDKRGVAIMTHDILISLSHLLIHINQFNPFFLDIILDM